MIRLLLLVAVLGGVGGYFTRPEETQMRAGADAVLQDPRNISETIEGAGAQLLGDRIYSNYYVASKYTVSLGDNPVVECWGAFTQVKCDRVAQAEAEAAS